MSVQEIKESINNKQIYQDILKSIKNTAYKDSFFKKISHNSITDEDASKLDKICISDVQSINFEFLRYFPNIESIVISRVKEPIDIGPFIYIQKLNTLAVYDSVIKDFSPLCECINLSDIDYMADNKMNECTDDYSFLSFLPELFQADFSYKNVEDLSVFKNNKKLKELCVSGNNIKNINALSELSELDYIEAENCSLTSLDEFLNIKSLKSVYVQDNNFTEEQKKDYKEKFSYLEKFEI